LRLFSDYQKSLSGHILDWSLGFLFDQTIEVFAGSCTPGDIRAKWLSSPTPEFISITALLVNKQLREIDTGKGFILLSRIGKWTQKDLLNWYYDSLWWSKVAIRIIVAVVFAFYAFLAY
jgi:hypothetical protein